MGGRDRPTGGRFKDNLHYGIIADVIRLIVANIDSFETFIFGNGESGSMIGFALQLERFYRMNLRHRASFIALLMSVLIQVPSLGQVSDFESFPTEGRTLWHQVLSPNNSEVLAIINNQPFSFDSSSSFRQEQLKAEPILQQALAVARQYETQSPRDLVECLANIV